MKIKGQYKIYFHYLTLSETKNTLQNSLAHISNDSYNPKAIIYFFNDHMSKTKLLFNNHTKEETFSFLKNYINYKFSQIKTLKKNKKKYIN